MLAHITDQPLDVSEHIEAVATSADGAIATFIGQVRDHDPSVSGIVTHLEYTAHPDAAQVLERIAAAHRRDHVRTAVSHRIGRLAVGEAAIVVAVASAHRAEALETCRRLVEQVKAELPIWKKEHLADGTHTWVGLT